MHEHNRQRVQTMIELVLLENNEVGDMIEVAFANVCVCVMSFTWWSEVPTKAQMANDGWSVDRQRHKECEFISVALTELIVERH